MINPLVGLGIKGVIWCKGENEAEGIDSVCYYLSGGFRQLIRSWRRMPVGADGIVMVGRSARGEQLVLAQVR
jgi:hypothetical protein